MFCFGRKSSGRVSLRVVLHFQDPNQTRMSGAQALSDMQWDLKDEKCCRSYWPSANSSAHIYLSVHKLSETNQAVSRSKSNSELWTQPRCLLERWRCHTRRRTRASVQSPTLFLWITCYSESRRWLPGSSILGHIAEFEPQIPHSGTKLCQVPPG